MRSEQNFTHGTYQIPIDLPGIDYLCLSGIQIPGQYDLHGLQIMLYYVDPAQTYHNERCRMCMISIVVYPTCAVFGVRITPPAAPRVVLLRSTSPGIQYSGCRCNEAVFFSSRSRVLQYLY